MDETLSPEECYLHWYNRINDGYYHYVNIALESIVQTGKIIQVEYTWNHPAKGDVMVQCMGARVEDKNGMICVEGYQRIVSDLERPDFLPDSLKSEMFENVQGKNECESMEIMLRNKKKIYKWFKIKTKLMSEKEQDRHTLLVLVEPAEQERTMELEYTKKSDFYEAMLSETAAYAEVDMESKSFMKTGGLWATYEKQCREEKRYSTKAGSTERSADKCV